MGASSKLLEKVGIAATLPDGTQDPGLFVGGEESIDGFVAAIGRHRHPERDLDPPLI